jgi:hypothetical protein
VSLGRFERPAHCLEGSCSILLSYRDEWNSARFYDKTIAKTTTEDAMNAD